jgi:hypothetical protein
MSYGLPKPPQWANLTRKVNARARKIAKLRNDIEQCRAELETVILQLGGPLPNHSDAPEQVAEHAKRALRKARERSKQRGESSSPTFSQGAS